MNLNRTICVCLSLIHNMCLTEIWIKKGLEIHKMFVLTRRIEVEDQEHV